MTRRSKIKGNLQRIPPTRVRARPTSKTLHLGGTHCGFYDKLVCVPDNQDNEHVNANFI